MGQAGAQREPSMEEILASIRKIIETNDKTGGTAKSSDMPAQISQNTAAAKAPLVSAGSNTDAAAKPDFSDTSSKRDQEAWSALRPKEDAPAAYRPISEPVAGGEIPSVDALSDQQAVRPSQARDNDDAAPVSLADIAARMRGEQGSGAIETVLGDEAVYELQDMLVGDISREEARISVRAKASRDAADGLEEVAKELARIENEKALAEQKLAQLQSREATADDVMLDSSELDDEETYMDDETGPADALENLIAPEIERQLISVDVSEKVAQSFAALDAVMASGPQRNFDEIAEDLLRPMLQNWLDDNLPTLVERLVREEIERVSRGNRR